MQLSVNLALKKTNWHAHYEAHTTDAICLGLVGRSGSGKTTLLRLLSGLESAIGGQISFNGEPWQSQQHFVKPACRNIAYASQENLLLPHLTIRKNLLLACQRGGLQDAEFTDLIGQMGILTWLDKKPAQLSGGQRQRVSLARALVQKPALMLLDEPLAALDAQSRFDLLQLLAGYRQRYNVPMVYVSHHLDEIVDQCDQCWIIESGKIIDQGRTDTVLYRSTLKAGIHKSELGSVLTFTAMHWHVNDQLMQLQLRHNNETKTIRANQTAWAPVNKNMVGHVVNLLVLAHDVILSATPLTNSSLQNCFYANITNISSTHHDCQVQLTVDGQPLLATLSKKSYREMNLKIGQPVYAHVKAMSAGFEYYR